MTVLAARIRILVVEDNRLRLQTILDMLPGDIVPCVATTAGRAIGMVQRDRKALAGIMLDYDLQERTETAEDFTRSGADVAAVIARQVPRQVPVLVHTMSLAGSGEMSRELVSAGFSVTRIPMADLTPELLAGWIEEVRDNWDDG